MKAPFANLNQGHAFLLFSPGLGFHFIKKKLDANLKSRLPIERGGFHLAVKLIRNIFTKDCKPREAFELIKINLKNSKVIVTALQWMLY